MLLNRPLSHQFPSKIGELIVALQERGVSRNTLILLLRCALIQSENDSPLLLLIGAPMRGIQGEEAPKQHLTAWWIDSEVANALRLAMPKTTDSEQLRDLRAEYEEAYFKILEKNQFIGAHFSKIVLRLLSVEIKAPSRIGFAGRVLLSGDVVQLGRKSQKGWHGLVLLG